MFVLDTDVVSRTSPFSQHPAGVRDWVNAHAAVCYLSVMTIAELWRGAELLRMKGALRKASDLEAWIGAIESSVRGRILSADPAVGRTTGILLARAEAVGHQPSFVDACIAATAAIHDFTVVTFNARHFVAFGVPHRTPLRSAAEP